MLRGGGWNNNPTNVRVSNRNRNEPTNRNHNIGFRCAGYGELSGPAREGPEPDFSRNVRVCPLLFRAVLPSRRACVAGQILRGPGFLVASANVSPVALLGHPQKNSPGGKGPPFGIPPRKPKTQNTQLNSPAQRKPMRWNRFEGTFPTRNDTRTTAGLKSQPPPRSTRLSPSAGPGGLASGEFA